MDDSRFGADEDRCESCRFFADFNECRRHAPILVMSDSGPRSRYPIVDQFHWCGDYERDGVTHSSPSQMTAPRTVVVVPPFPGT